MDFTVGFSITQGHPMDTSICLVYGALISFVVSVLKKIPFVKNNPKWVAFFLSSIIGIWTSTHGSLVGIDYKTILECVLAQFATSVATHEAVVQPVKKAVGDDPESDLHL